MHSIGRGQLDPRSRQIALQALSRTVGDSESTDLTSIRVIATTLGRYGTADLRDSPAAARAFGLTDLPTVASEAVTVLRRIGTTREEVRALWHRVSLADGPEAQLPVELIAALFPGDIPLVAAAVLLDGPVIAARRLDHVVREVVEDRERRGERPLARNTLKGISRATRFFMSRFNAMRELGHPDPCLQAWVALPKRARLPSEVGEPRDCSAPPLALLRVIWRQHRAELERRLGLPMGADLAPAILAARGQDLRDRKVFRLLRNFALLSVLATVGMRRAALLRLRRSDLVLVHRSQDGRYGPALRLTPRKRVDWDETRFKPIPAGLADVLLAWSALVELLAEVPVHGDDPMFIGELHRPDRAMTPQALGRIVSGSTAANQPALVPRRTRPVLETASPPDTDGHSPHQLRSAAHQMVVAGVRAFCADTGVQFEHMSEECVADCLLDHRIRRDAYGYGDINRPWGRERWSGIATATTWSMLTTSAGAQRELDLDALSRARENKRALEHELTLIEARLNVVNERVQAAADDNDALVSRLDNLFQLEITYRQERQVRDRLRDLELEIERLTYNPSYLRPVPDEELLAGRQPHTVRDAASAERAEQRQRRVRDWLTVTELAELCERSVSTVRDWASGRRLPFKPGDPRNPWTTEVPPVDQSLGTRLRRIAVDGVSPSYIADEERLERVLAAWPAGWSRSACRLPLRVGAPGDRGILSAS
jgi:hypothetical protein